MSGLVYGVNQADDPNSRRGWGTRDRPVHLGTAPTVPSFLRDLNAFWVLLLFCFVLVWKEILA